MLPASLLRLFPTVGTLKLGEKSEPRTSTSMKLPVYLQVTLEPKIVQVASSVRFDIRIVPFGARLTAIDAVRRPVEALLAAVQLLLPALSLQPLNVSELIEALPVPPLVMLPVNADSEQKTVSKVEVSSTEKDFDENEPE